MDSYFHKLYSTERVVPCGEPLFAHDRLLSDFGECQKQNPWNCCSRIQIPLVHELYEMLGKIQLHVHVLVFSFHSLYSFMLICQFNIEHIRLHLLQRITCVQSPFFPDDNVIENNPRSKRDKKWVSSRENLSSGFATTVDSNRPAQLQKLGRGLKFRI